MADKKQAMHPTKQKALAMLANRANEAQEATNGKGKGKTSKGKRRC